MTAIPAMVSPAPTMSQPIRSLTVDQPQPGDRACDVYATVCRVSAPGRSRVEGKEPRKRGQAHAARNEEPGGAPWRSHRYGR